MLSGDLKSCHQVTRLFLGCFTRKSSPTAFRPMSTKLGNYEKLPYRRQRRKIAKRTQGSLCPIATFRHQSTRLLRSLQLSGACIHRLIQLRRHHGHLPFLLRRPKSANNEPNKARGRRQQRPRSDHCPSSFHLPFISSNLPKLIDRESETQRTLLRQVYTVPRHLALKARRRMFIGMHGEIYGDVECRQSSLHRAGAKASRGGKRGDGWDGDLGTGARGAGVRYRSTIESARQKH